jgi:hypothetical protein
LYLGGRINIEKVDEHSNKQEPRNRDPELCYILQTEELAKEAKKKKRKKKTKKKKDHFPYPNTESQ